MGKDTEVRANIVSKEYVTVTSALIVKPESEPIFSSRATRVSIDDEGGGCFVTVSQSRNNVTSGDIAIDVEEWPELKNAIDDMIDKCVMLDKQQATIRENDTEHN
jgi:hypothetical protein